MNASEARRILAGYEGDEAPANLPVAILRLLNIDDNPHGVRIEVGELKEGVFHVDWNGVLFRGASTILLKQITLGHVSIGIHH